MKNIFTLLILLLFSFKLYSQEKDTYQADSVMKANGIKTKIRYHENTASHAKEIYNFDKQGKLIEFVLTSNSSEKETQFNILYQYNEKNQILKEIYRSTGTPASKSRITEYVYSSNGDFKATEYVGRKSNIISEVIFDADSAKQTRRLITNGQVRRENISYYESPLYTYKFKGFEVSQGEPKVFIVGGKEFRFVPEDKWDYDFKNKFDSQGRITERTRIVKGEIKDKSIYTYNAEGLLTEKLEIIYSDGQESRSKELFKYVKW